MTVSPGGGEPSVEELLKSLAVAGLLYDSHGSCFTTWRLKEMKVKLMYSIQVTKRSRHSGKKHNKKTATVGHHFWQPHTHK